MERATLYEALGGKTGLRECVTVFAERLLADTDLSYVYADTSVDDEARKLDTLFTELLATGSQSGATEHATLEIIRISPDDWHRWSGHLMTVLHLRQLEHDALERWASILTDLGIQYRESSAEATDPHTRRKLSTRPSDRARRG